MTNNRQDFMQYPDFFGDLTDMDAEEMEMLLDESTADGVIECPFLPLRDVVLFPQMVMPLLIGRDRSIAAVQAAMANGERLVAAAQKDPESFDPTAEDIYPIGTETAINRFMRMPDNANSVLAQGRRRVEIIEFVQWQPYIRVRARLLPDQKQWDDETEPLMRTTMDYFDRVVMLSRRIPEDAYTFALNIDEPSWLADFIASTLEIPLLERQDILGTLNVTARLRKVAVALAKELDVLQIENQIQSRVEEEIDRTQREHFLREQMRAIQGELGEMDAFGQELQEVRQAIENKNLPPEVRAKAEKELARLGSMPPMSPEVGIIRTYLDWLIELPWLDQSEENLDVSHATAVLENDHYGLDQVKDRILEHIASLQIAKDSLRVPILCFVGPPGTGKTSLGRSIATALNREFVRMSLGGVRDEAEIRGHRRTYIGAMPGRFVQALRRCGTNNPLMMLDEVDKIGQDFRGDPASALLEVLDPEQNNTFADHYLELDFDLSNVMFITTANLLEPIPAPLRDRMEVIDFRSYLEEEKLEIAHNYLLPRQIEQHGLLAAGLRFEDEALQTLIRQYTYEAGVRNLEREIASICRKIARRVAEQKRYPKRITAKQIVDLLGPPRITDKQLRDEDEIGVANGVAWTAYGGDIMFVEVNLMPGKGSLTLTGQLGDVMRESAQAALTYTRSQADVLGLAADVFENTDIHIHLPEGAVPKDGPSAGVPLAVALISAFTGRAVRRDVGMTGEITLRGRVLPVGGIREKALAARRFGIVDFLLPAKNENDILNIPKRLRQDLNFILVDRLDDVLPHVLL